MPNSPADVFDRLSTPLTPEGTRRLFGTVCVLGGALAGLVAARVLADHADRVVIIEPDGPDAGSHGETRPGVPQGYQVHVLLPGGRAQLERFFPGIVDEAVAEGAALHPPHAVASYLDDVEQITTPNTRFVASSRPFLESHVRRRTLALPNVALVTGRVTGLRYTRDAVDAVRYTTGAGEVVEAADFVVDATGRSSRLSDWLERDGWPRPEMERLQVDVRYLSARFRRSKDWTGPQNGISRYTPPFDSKGLAVAAVSAIENQQWTVMLAYFGSPAGDFLTRCRELAPIYAEAVGGEPLGEVVPYRHPDSRWRHFEALDRFPARLAVVGDAVASFNPVYGQGMSSATLHASCLSEYLRSGPDLDAPARLFLDLQNVVVDAAWRTSTAGDAARLGIAPPPATDQERRQAWAMRQVRAAAGRDVTVGTAFRAVSYMTAHPASLFAPELVSRAAKVNDVSEEELRREFGV
ncbi:FAD-dependent oxidoreductase [Actinophytocola oryzae]|uniref:2-polyprenyl-6-methoxyphenol hydroxylase-like FAD-dependent oxidoreductase n=1 Tax=Actinophytocola oryzae TaxID=502181 RepID=A0A4R7W6F5_9PSEU|nr:FAD-binding monooxygenase [Actinophytocola oryzae]TDV57875.1 2-polyprenyl-6-methoxyphenol hydroxylase-like FAD-dependent oxidoreductase [Actinophytocola oryzae]